MYRRLLLGLALVVLVLGVFTLLQPQEPDPALIRLAVRATLHALPTQTPLVVEVTRVVEVTATPLPEPTSTPEPSATETPVTTAAETPVSSDAPPEPEVQPASVPAEPVRVEAAIAVPAVEQPAADDYAATGGCPTDSDRTYSLIPIEGGGIDHPDVQHGDLNLNLRGYRPVNASASLVHINGPTDGDAPQIGAVLPDRSASGVSTFSVNEWDWGCGEHGCRGGGPVGVDVSLLGLATSPGAPVSIPSRNAQIYGGGYVALVLYAEGNRLTLVYTREDSVANGYAVHIENFCVDPALLAAYRTANASGRRNLPAVRNGEIVGVASSGEVAVAVRDRGAFQDPRSRKDWWR